MAGVRLYPAYHGYGLDHADFAKLLAETAKRGLLVQIVLRMEDERCHHPALVIGAVDVGPLVEVLKKLPQAKVQLINSAGPAAGKKRDCPGSRDASHVRHCRHRRERRRRPTDRRARTTVTAARFPSSGWCSGRTLRFSRARAR